MTEKERQIKYANSKWILTNFFVAVLANLSSVMIRISAWGAYLLLVPQWRALIRDRAHFFFEKQPNAQNKTLIVLKTEE